MNKELILLGWEVSSLKKEFIESSDNIRAHVADVVPPV